MIQNLLEIFFFSFLKLKKDNAINEGIKILEIDLKGVIFIEKNSNDKIKTMITLRARPSMPSIKFIELIIATIINIVNSCDANRPNS